MGWTLTASDWNQRTSRATACLTTGIQVTCYAGNTTTTTDEAGVTRTNTLDGLVRLTQVVENGITATTGYGYDSQGNLTSVMQSGVNGRSFVFDSLGRLTTAVNPESASTGYLYDNNGNLTKRTDGRGIASTYYYDALNRLTDKSYSDGTPGPHYQFAGGQDFLNSVQSSASLYTYSNYDALGRPGAGSQMTNAQTWNFPSMVWTAAGAVGGPGVSFRQDREHDIRRCGSHIGSDGGSERNSDALREFSELCRAWRAIGLEYGRWTVAVDELHGKIADGVDCRRWGVEFDVRLGRGGQ